MRKSMTLSNMFRPALGWMFLIGFLTSALTQGEESLAETQSGLHGTVVFQDYGSDTTVIPVTVELRGERNYTRTIYPDTQGHFCLTGIDPGTYDLWIKVPHGLAASQNGINFDGDTTLAVPFALANGDCDGDNEVTDRDVSIILSAMDSVTGGTSWNAQGDLDADGEITSTDLSIVFKNLGLKGDVLPDSDTDTLELTPLGNLTHSTPAHFEGSWDVNVPSNTSLRVINDPTSAGGHGRVVEYLDNSTFNSLELYAKMSEATNDCLIYAFDLYVTPTTHEFRPVVIGSDGTEVIRQVWSSDGRIDNDVDSQTVPLGGAGTFAFGVWYRVAFTVYPLNPAGGEYARYDMSVVRESDGMVVLDQKNLSGCASVGSGVTYWKFGIKSVGILCKSHLYLDNVRIASRGNIAYGRPCTFSPAPSYSTCTDSNDPWQLTDGRYTTAGLLWNDVNAVGWGRSTSGVTISLDLGQVEPIRGMSFSTASSYTSGVPWPSTIYILASTDNINFYRIAELVRQTLQSPNPETYQRFRYGTESLCTKGRYLKVYILTPGILTFCDEIEIYRGKPSYLDIPYPGLPVTPAILLADKDARIRNGCYTRLRRDLDQVRQRIQNSLLDTAAKNIALDQVKNLAEQIDVSTFPENPDTFKAIVPYNELHATIFKLNAQVLAAQGLPPLTVWHSHRYARLGLFDEPTGENPTNPGVLGVTLMANEHRADVLNLTNTTQSDLPVQFQVQGLPGGINPAYMTAYQVEYVDTREGVVVAAALTPLTDCDGFYHTVVPAGMTRQIWLSFNPDTSVSSGTYTGLIHVTSSVLTQSYPFVFKLSNLTLSEPDIDLLMWDYAALPQDGLTLANRDVAIADMKNHGVTIAETIRTQIPYPAASQLDADGNLIGTPDFTPFDNYVATWSGARGYQLFANVTPTTTFPPGAGGKVRGTAAFANAIRQWSAAWAAHNQSIGLTGPGRIQINWIDEPRTDEQYQTILDWAVPFKAGSANNWTFVDFTNEQNIAALSPIARNCLNHVDIICPVVYWPGMTGYNQFKTLFTELQQQGKTTWFYSCGGPSRHFDPTSYYRLQPWHCWVQNMTGSGFWSYGSTGAATNWNEYDSVGKVNYSPAYIDPVSITSGRHWEAVREGLEDYQYIKMLKIKTDQLEAMGTNPALVTQARNFLASQPLGVINGVGRSFAIWPKTETGHALPDQVRLQALELMEQMGF